MTTAAKKVKTPADEERERLHRAILEEPFNLDLRRVYVDHLEEHATGKPSVDGDHGVERANFIRTQLWLTEFEAEYGSNVTALRQCSIETWEQRAEMREHELMLFRLGDARGDIPLPYRGEHSKVQDGLHERVWEPPGVKIIPSRGGGIPPEEQDRPRWEFRWYNGFVQRVKCTVADWQLLGPYIVSHAPITLVNLMDHNPTQVSNTFSRTRYRLETNVWPIGFMHRYIADVIDGRDTYMLEGVYDTGPGSVGKHMRTCSTEFGSLVELTKVLSLGAINWARQQAEPKLPVLKKNW